MIEDRIVRQVKQYLDANMAQLDDNAAQRLTLARQRALQAYVQKTPFWTRVMAGLQSWLIRHGWQPRVLSAWVSAALLLAMVTGTHHVLNDDCYDEEVDAVLLADELPLGAYVDNGFDQWLEQL
ncbi:DUF3619 family protein [Chitinivorax sp. B]|uniref:DUF3619 family protein n=1 Tax=Chitinivorax sp. B TaxID=2502235 RepID=UPI0010F978D2|nr:DUF3619 family protein [Chitinivorax sp. B]